MLKKLSTLDDSPRIKAELADFHSCRNELSFLQNEIGRTCAQIDAEYGIRISVKKSNYWIPLCDRNEIQGWFDSIVKRSEQEVMTFFRRDFGLDISMYPTYEDLLSSDLVKDAEKLRRYTFLQSWNRAKGDLFEWTILLALVSGYGSSQARESGEVRLGSGSPSIPITLGGEVRFLWYQKKITAHRSQLAARPDLTITRDAEAPSRNTILGFIECKATKRISAKTIREVSGTAYDIGPGFAMIASFQPVPRIRIQGAKRIGVTIMVNPLQGLQRKSYLEGKFNLPREIKSEIERTDRERPYLAYDRERRTWMEEKLSR